MLGNSIVVVRTRPRAIPLAMITHGFLFLSHDEYGAPLGGPLGRRSFDISEIHSIHKKNVNSFVERNCAR